MKWGICNSVSWSVGRQQSPPPYTPTPQSLFSTNDTQRGLVRQGALFQHIHITIAPSEGLSSCAARVCWMIHCGSATWPQSDRMTPPFHWVNYKNRVVGGGGRCWDGGDLERSAFWFVCYRIMFVICKLDGMIQSDWMKINKRENERSCLKCWHKGQMRGFWVRSWLYVKVCDTRYKNATNKDGHSPFCLFYLTSFCHFLRLVWASDK